MPAFLLQLEVKEEMLLILPMFAVRDNLILKFSLQLIQREQPILHFKIIFRASTTCASTKTLDLCETVS